MENKRKHLEMIQAVISRMAGNLFFLKGWAITLVTGVFALSTANGINTDFVFLAYFLLVIFWVLDSYYLSQERRFRALYDAVRKIKEDEIDFSMSTEKYDKKPGNSVWEAMFSQTLLVFYVGLGIAMLAITTFIKR